MFLLFRSYYLQHCLASYEVVTLPNVNNECHSKNNYTYINLDIAESERQYEGLKDFKSQNNFANSKFIKIKKLVSIDICVTENMFWNAIKDNFTICYEFLVE